MTGKINTEPCTEAVPPISTEAILAAVRAIQCESDAHSAITFIHPVMGVFTVPAKNEHLLVVADGE